MLFHAATKSLLFTAINVGAILSAMPAVRLPPGGEFNVAVKHTEAATTALRAMGYKAPSPIVAYYNWPGKFTPFDHQRSMAEFHTLHKRCFNLSEMGTAKTNGVLWAADWLMTRGAVKKALIIAPLSIMDSVWAQSIFGTLMHRTCAVVHGSREKRHLALAMDVDFYIINPDGLKIGELRELIAKREDINLVIVDEASKYRNADTDNYRALVKIVGTAAKPILDRRLWLMSGTPCPNAPTDAWSQARLVNANVPIHFGSFRRQTMVEVSDHIWKPMHDGYRVAFSVMQPGIRYEKKDCLDLPPVTTLPEWMCDMTPSQKRMFKSMADEMVAETDSGADITAVNAADRVNKLRQIMLGAIKIGEGDYETLDAGPRIKLLIDGIEQAKAKVYVIVPFKGAIRALELALQKAGYSVGVLNGDVPLAKRNRIISDFKNTETPHVVLCHDAVVSHGLDFTVADTLIFYGPIYSNDNYQQVLDRFNRAGQVNKMTIIRICCCATEKAIYDMPLAKQKGQASFLELYRALVSTLH